METIGYRIRRSGACCVEIDAEMDVAREREFKGTDGVGQRPT
jgi:hypothetical protein